MVYVKNKKQIRKNFRLNVFTRDKYQCQVCGIRYTASDADLLDAHHIIDRNEMPNGGYVKENGITVCKGNCHRKVERWHQSNGTVWVSGLHPDDLYAMINSSYKQAYEASVKLGLPE